MATVTMASAAGAAALLYYTLNKKLQSGAVEIDEEESVAVVTGNNGPLGIERVSTRLIRAPATWLETISTLSETLRFTYSETLGKWPIGDLAFGISFLLKRQGNLCVQDVFGGNDSVQLKGPELAVELKYLVNLLTLCWHFSKKPFSLFLEETGYTVDDVLLQEPKAGILKPAFTILVDHKAKCLLLLIRGTHSIKDTLTAVTGAVVPFHHTVVHEGGVTDLVLGYAHCGMVAAARWIAKLATPCVIKALDEHPDYKLKIVGHSLGGGTAALLTFILREQKELSSTSCVTFAPAACMTWELAESGVDVITSIINGADLVPTFSAASVDDLRAEVTASAWLNDLRNQIEQTRILSTVYRSASALGASARAKVAGAGAVLRPVSSGTQAVMRRAQSMAHAALRRPTVLSSWSCIGPRRRANAVPSIAQEQSSEFVPMSTETSEPLIASSRESTSKTHKLPLSSSEWNSEVGCSYSETRHIQNELDVDVDVADGEDLIESPRNEDLMTEVELWQQLEHELYDRAEGDVDVEKEIREEEKAAMEEVGATQPEGSAPEAKEVHRFFPPGKIMHIMNLQEVAEDEVEEVSSSDSGSRQSIEGKVGIFLTPRVLYSKLRLSHSMISDHLMPLYRRQMEKLIREFEDEASEGNHYNQGIGVDL
ncbi:hypothetical protein SOVF_053250 [Spinacia oleracea]|nr:uncharacterized protein LOC110804091 isoform X2 [Spinacia oleracea]XP_021865364.1 uncharacterized protein LOC110804091 isoform X2 [Spinacia oleracea]XP_021865371.1 uncharacterized protein LOC110804091 isoform X2 [Spinacia oleracea]XP_021865378.1 uncharacterized protein LOC110804091 isoform X2 [Spinacia oleracea]KNA20369.1 hypothetical protein SOVF_053250 [Spinacia oleracea]